MVFTIDEVLQLAPKAGYWWLYRLVQKGIVPTVMRGRHHHVSRLTAFAVWLSSQYREVFNDGAISSLLTTIIVAIGTEQELERRLEADQHIIALSQRDTPDSQEGIGTYVDLSHWWKFKAACEEMQERMLARN